MPAWDPEVTVDASLARALIASQFPALAGAPVHPFDSGWDNTVLRLGTDLVLRFPRREIAVPGVLQGDLTINDMGTTVYAVATTGLLVVPVDQNRAPVFEAPPGALHDCDIMCELVARLKGITAEEADKLRIQKCFEHNKQRFLTKYGCLPGTAEYEALFDPSTFGKG